MRNAFRYIPVLAAAAGMLSAAGQSASGIALEADPGQKLVLFVPVQPRSHASFQWTASLGSFLGPANTPSVTFVTAGSGVAIVTCRVTEGGKTAEHSLAIEVSTDGAKPAAVESAPVSAVPGGAPAAGNGTILGDGKLSLGFDMGVDSSAQRRDWLTPGEGFLKMAYPAGQTWGAVFVTAGRAAPAGSRHSRDMSAYSTLRLELRGERGGEHVEVGIKDQGQNDDGSEAKEPLALTSAWKVFEIPLRRFTGADLHQTYVLAEFVFDAGPQTVYVRRVEYVSGR